MELQEIIKQIVRETSGYMEDVAVAYEGAKVEHDGETWYELTVRHHDGYFKGWYALFDGEICYYDQDQIAHEDRIPAIDEAIAKY
jgi:hypothetical protein